jgi:hypothetical protein
LPAVIAPFVAFTLGIALAMRIRFEADRYEDKDRRAALRIAALFGALVFAPVSAYFLVFAPDWSFAYLVDPRRIPSALELLLVIANAATVPLGFVAGHRAVRRRALRELVALFTVPAAVAFIFVVAFSRELRVEGTYHQFHSKFGMQPVAGGAIGYAILWMDAMLAIGFALSLQALSRPHRPASAGDAQRGPPPGRPG